jgi:hypothetical protein
VQFHACKDCPEVREKVYRFLKMQDFKFQCIVARKNLELFRKKFDLKESKIYKYLVTKLLENRLHLYSEIDCYFSAMGNVVRQDNMQEAINDAILTFKSKWNNENTNNIRVIIQKSSEEPMLWAVDYVLWTIQRAYEKGEFRYYNYLKDKISLIIDIFDTKKISQKLLFTKKLARGKKNRPCIRLGFFRNAWHEAHFHLNRIYLIIVRKIKNIKKNKRIIILKLKRFFTRTRMVKCKNRNVIFCFYGSKTPQTLQSKECGVKKLTLID